MPEKINNLTYLDVHGRRIPRVPSKLDLADRLGSWKARWGINRMSFKVIPGLYAVGNPAEDSPVMVSANYKMSFDVLRSNLDGIDAWILVLDTKGINVWCAAGKGTFGTNELIRRINEVNLHEIVKHRNLLVPQLGAPGINASIVRKLAGFRVRFGPVRAKDIQAYLKADMKATPEMRLVNFPFADRLVLVPLEIVGGFHITLLVAAIFFILAGLSTMGYSGSLVLTNGLPVFILVVGSFIAAAVLGPLLLPWLPGRAFATKGIWIGLLIAIAIAITGWKNPGPFGSWISLAAWIMMLPALTSFMLMNFTGASTYTSLSGVKHEMKIALPVQLIGAGLGLCLWIAGRFV